MITAKTPAAPRNEALQLICRSQIQNHTIHSLLRQDQLQVDQENNFPTRSISYNRQIPPVDLFSKPQTAGEKALSVTQLLRRMKNLLEIQIGEVWVEGEVSNLRKQGSGHWYFSLKDEGAQIQCAMFGARKRQGAETLLDGAKVRVFAEASVYEARGQLQIIVIKAELAGAGDLLAKFEALKRKLAAEGLFDAERKQAISGFPRTIGIITSGTGAALQDILNVLGRRAPWVQPVLFPVRVQGKGAELEIAQAIAKLGAPERYNYPRCDVIIVGRGGGSIEDLWNFNEEVVARAIAACPIPIISAVGHEIDFTIADFVADLRAPTPSAAAELATADGAALVAQLATFRRRLQRPTAGRLSRAQSELNALQRGIIRRDADRVFREPILRLDSARANLSQAISTSLDSLNAKLSELRARHRLLHPSKVLVQRLENLTETRRRLDKASQYALQKRSDILKSQRSLIRNLGPEATFQRGFSITLDDQGKLLRSVRQTNKGSKIQTKLSDGIVLSEVLG